MDIISTPGITNATRKRADMWSRAPNSKRETTSLVSFRVSAESSDRQIKSCLCDSWAVSGLGA